MEEAEAVSLTLDSRSEEEVLAASIGHSSSLGALSRGELPLLMPLLTVLEGKGDEAAELSSVLSRVEEGSVSSSGVVARSGEVDAEVTMLSSSPPVAAVPNFADTETNVEDECVDEEAAGEPVIVGLAVEGVSSAAEESSSSWAVTTEGAACDESGWVTTGT